ncbi:tRNA (adenosine(37)-N6)-threonylcarbamoyltransferase complex transferase subunit TsaD [Rhodohalobacter sulfatireducens]|uniref:tRNA N6-adenosine threonylcarbamoyltransferase n=1 Tax=Rhodohalobacter sulfatireducens TaxID=2911366 RepID=A0ABS9KC26_9BACT|nr:tRNA (adenosine(37)-N6)-threonylcarbamoyltransferase complex transferase subunit TsaD [Rhodohalobacter sulfatireducens]MCG2588380.1 tRNA (adenosine(37)-N6)-threonylcarbamoyltransferase complex transferase subunit TsaD [Rhodohalobacter sulfatireducens]
MTILGIESSCDETAAAVWADGSILSNIIASQTIHEQFGGVVPELASRAHHKTIWKTVDQALREADISLDQVDSIAVARGPGLIGSLLVGLSFAKGLSISQERPIIGVNHIDAHMYANFIEHEEVYPFLALIVSGGHTRLVQVDELFSHKVLGKTRDDAAGEAFDKIGKLLNLDYPAGPIVDKLSKEGDPAFHDFPRSMINKGLDFSFSGLKTSVLYYTQEKGEEFVQQNLNDICASVSAAITDVLHVKLKRAVKKTGVKNIMVAGGVSANSMLREKVEEMAQKMDLHLMIPSIQYCTDNAAMIAITGALKAREGRYDDLQIKPFARLA